MFQGNNLYPVPEPTQVNEAKKAINPIAFVVRMDTVKLGLDIVEKVDSPLPTKEEPIRFP